MTRGEHLQWTKDRALALLPGDPEGAIQSLLSDLTNHDELRAHDGILLTGQLLLGGHLETSEQVQKHIEGFG